MAKATTIKIKLQSTADTGFFYVTKKNSRTMTDKMTKRKYDPIAKKHVEFKETKIKLIRFRRALSERRPRAAFLFVFPDGSPFHRNAAALHLPAFACLFGRQAFPPDCEML